MKELIANLKKNFNNVDKSIFNAADNVNLDCVLGWQQNGEKFSFLDEFSDFGEDL